MDPELPPPSRRLALLETYIDTSSYYTSVYWTCVHNERDVLNFQGKSDMISEGSTRSAASGGVREGYRT
jgi:hypothetical protein